MLSFRTNPPRPADRPEAVATVAIFAAAIIFSLWAVRIGWQNQNLPVHEFRQTQTALSAYFIQQENNFSLAYPTPILGKPWSVPMEFPLYQWTVVSLSNTTGLDLTKSARLVSGVSFYLTLPFLYLLLGRLGLSWTRRLVALGLVVCCPLYIFWARSFLIETMALFFSVLFLWSYLNAIERRKPAWWLFASLAGVVAGLVKVTTFLVILLPAAGWIVAWLWQQRPGINGGSWRKMAGTAAWALSAVALPCLFAGWWVRFSDATKALNPMGAFLSSEHLQHFNLGSGETRFSAVIWQQHFDILFRDIVPWWTLAACGGLALCFARRWWSWIGLLLGSFFLVQLIFPELYARHEYYYVANAFMLMVAMGLVLCGVLESRLPRLLAWGFVLIVFGGQVWRYTTTYYPVQQSAGNDGNLLTRALQRATKPNDVLVIAGHDWNAFTAYFSRRRALMIRSGMEYNWKALASAAARMHGETVGALVLHGTQRNNLLLIEQMIREFDLDARPVFTCGDATVYLHRRQWLVGIQQVKPLADGKILQITAEATKDESFLIHHEVETSLLPENYQQVFAGMTPLPWKFQSEMGPGRYPYDGRDYYNAHPVTRLWFKVPAGQRRISVEVGLIREAYLDSVPVGDRTDGIELAIFEEPPGYASRPLFSRLLSPHARPEDKGIQRLECTADFTADTVVEIAVLPGANHSFVRDWAMIGRIEIK